MKVHFPKCSVQAGHPEETMVTVMVEEDGKWKMSDLPALRVGILKYKRVMDAIEADDRSAF